MTFRALAAAALAAACITTTTQAVSLGEAVDRSLTSAEFAAVADLPPGQLAALHDLSALFAARRQSVATADVDLRIAAALEALAAEQDAVAALPDVAYAVALTLQAEVVLEELREIVPTVASEQDPIAIAIEGLLASRRDGADLHVRRGADGPDSTCARDYVFCLTFCSFQPTFVLRSACGIDCDIDLAACLHHRLLGEPQISVPGGPDPR